MHDVINNMREKRRNDEGFTLIELLVVVVIIGVLVAIAVPVYLNYRKGAADKSAQSDVRGAISAIEQYYTENGNAYPTGFANSATSTIAIGTQSITLSDKTSMTLVVVASPASYKVCATNSGGSGKVYLYNSAVGGSVTVPTPAVTMAACA